MNRDVYLHSLCALTHFVFKALGGQPEAPRVRILKYLPDVTVWLVDGKYVRDNIDVDFTEGGNGEKYVFIPNDEIWIDNTLDEAEWNDTISHELLERFMMSRGDQYDPAHDVANVLETTQREYVD